MKNRLRDVTSAEDDAKYEVDVKNTLLRAIPFFLFFALVLTFVWKTITLITSIEDPNTQLIGLIVFMFCTIKLTYWLGYPDLHLRERKK